MCTATERHQPQLTASKGREAQPQDCLELPLLLLAGRMSQETDVIPKSLEKRTQHCDMLILLREMSSGLETYGTVGS